MPPRETRFQRARRQRVAGEWDEDDVGDVIGADPDPAAEIKELEANAKKLAEEIDAAQRAQQELQRKAAEVEKRQAEVKKKNEETAALREQTARTEAENLERTAQAFATQREATKTWEGMFWLALIGAGLYAMKQENKPKRRRR